MLRLICPRCYKYSYTVSVEVFSPCPYCGCLFSGKYGIEKRDEMRIKKEIPFVFPYEGQDFEASTVDFSESGLSIKIFGKPPLAVGTLRDLTLGALQINARIIWVKNLNDESLSGLQKLN